MLGTILVEYEDRINDVLGQGPEAVRKAREERRVEGQPLTMKFPRILGQRVVDRRSVWFEVVAEPKVEYLKKTVMRGLLRKKPVTEVETKRYADRFADIRVVVRADGWPDRLHVLRPHEGQDMLFEVMTEALRELETQVKVVLREENPS